MGQGGAGPALLRRVRSTLAPQNVASFTHQLRARRWEELNRRFPDLATMHVIDLGGYPWIWEQAPVRPAHLTVLNLEPSASQDGDRVTYVVGDACQPPPAVDRSTFDLVYSNSVIEHVGGRWRRKEFAASVHRLAPHHWIQTPARTFPVEPHWMFPGFQFLPISVQARISRRWPLAWAPFIGRSLDGAVDDVLSVELLTASEMRGLFPGSDIFRERLVGLTKSFSAVR